MFIEITDAELEQIINVLPFDGELYNRFIMYRKNGTKFWFPLYYNFGLKIAIVKAVRSFTNWSLPTAEDAVETEMIFDIGWFDIGKDQISNIVNSVDPRIVVEWR